MLSHKDRSGLERRVKEGSWGALSKLLLALNEESLDILKKTQDFRYYQARVNTLEEIISLLPNTPE